MKELKLIQEICNCNSSCMDCPLYDGDRKKTTNATKCMLRKDLPCDWDVEKIFNILERVENLVELLESLEKFAEINKRKE